MKALDKQTKKIVEVEDIEYDHLDGKTPKLVKINGKWWSAVRFEIADSEKEK